MARHAQNLLTIRPLPEGQHLLFGYILAPNAHGNFERTKVRRKSPDLTALAKLKHELESAAADHLQGIKNAGQTFRSHITIDQLHDAEAALRQLTPGRTLVECVVFTNRYLGAGAPTKCEEALIAWQRDQMQRNLKPVTMKDSVRRVKRFLEAVKPATLQEITHEATNDYVMSPGSSDYNRINDANNLTMWLKFCVERKLLKQHPLNFKLDAMRDRARAKTEPEILTIEQCQRLLDAAVRLYDGALVPYVVLGLWGFMRPEEPRRLRASHFRIDGRTVSISHRGEKLGSKFRQTIIPANVAPLIRRALETGAITEDRGVFFSVRLWMRVRAAAGLLELVTTTERGSMPTIKEGSSQWHNDIMRHTGMSYLFQRLRNEHIKAGVNPNAATEQAIREVTEQAGNSKRTAYLHYLRRVSDDAGDKFLAIRPTVRPKRIAEVVAISTVAA